jgi:hypothetical protein
MYTVRHFSIDTTKARFLNMAHKLNISSKVQIQVHNILIDPVTDKYLISKNNSCFGEAHKKDLYSLG